MALGYEGLIKIDIYTVLGTGSAVPRNRVRLESASGYGGEIRLAENEIGIGQPYNFDWSQYDGNLEFDVDKAVFQGALKDWVFNRQTSKTVLIRSRNGDVQQYDAFWNSMSVNASEGASLGGTVGFVALQRAVPYVWGNDYISNKKGYNLFCPTPTVGAPSPLNPSAMRNQYPVPFWNTQVWVKPTGGSLTKKNFTNWSLDFSQDIVKFFGCSQTAAGVDPGAQAPLYLAAGPMTVTFSGSYIEDFPGSNDFIGDTLDDLVVYVDSVAMRLKRLELVSEADNVQGVQALVPLTVEYAAYEVNSAA